MTNDSIEAQDVIKVSRYTSMVNNSKVIEETEEMIEKLSGIEDVIANFATCLSDLIDKNDQRVIKIINLQESYQKSVVETGAFIRE